MAPVDGLLWVAVAVAGLVGVHVGNGVFVAAAVAVGRETLAPVDGLPWRLGRWLPWLCGWVRLEKHSVATIVGVDVLVGVTVAARVAVDFVVAVACAVAVA